MEQGKAGGWTPPSNYQLREDFFAKHGDDPYAREIDRRWRRIGKLIEKGSKIRDGYLGR
jgi:hypothetical protein